MASDQDIFMRLDAGMKPCVVLATNTSALEVDAIAAATARPEDVIGLHFFSPANIMRLLEVVRGARSSDATIATAMAFARRIGKVAVVEVRSEEHTSELQSLMRISYAVFCLKKNKH